MKYTHKSIFAFLLLTICTSIFGVSGQEQFDLGRKIPIDPEVVTGELENGINYYIRRNTKAKGKADLRLVINAGSVLESESQQGLAHFLEHMAFNGTTHFKKNELVSYLQNLGVEFGADLNAHTSFDETVYKLSIPTDNDDIYNDGLQILRDWADGITLDEDAIDNERGVVAEELRGGLSAYRRMFNAYVPIITNDSRYSERLPIGKLDVILHADYQEIRDFYKDWYRPDLMAVVIVGDVDPKETERKIEEFFGPITPHPDPRERTMYSIPDNKEMTVAVVSDKEAEDVTFYAYYKKDREISTNLADYREDLLERLYSSMLNQRINQLVEKGNASFLNGGAGLGSFIGDKSAYYFGGSLKEKSILKGIRSLLVESERARRFGFTESELERHKKKILNAVNLRRKEDGKLNSRFYVTQYVDHFMNDRPIPGNEFQHQFYMEIMPGISVEEVNAVAKEWILKDNRTLVLTAPEKEGLELPDAQDLKKVFKAVESIELTPYVDELKVSSIMEGKPDKGEVIRSKYLEDLDVTEWTLSNGVKVVLKPTSYQRDIINMSAFRDGGSSLAPDSIYISARNSGSIVGESGMNGISHSGIIKLNMGKTVRVQPYINFYQELIKGMSSKEDLETMLKMTHLYYTAPNKDTDVFNATKDRLIAGSRNQDSNPLRYFYDEISKEISNDHLRATSISYKEYKEELKLKEVYSFYKERFSSADGFTFLFVGSFDPEVLKPLVETYIGSLPTPYVEKDWKDIGLRYVEGGIKKEYYRGSEEKSSVSMRFTGSFKFSRKKEKTIDALERLLRLKLYEELREEMGGVYGVRVSGFATDVPYDWYRMAIEFTCAPGNVHDLVAAAQSEISRIKDEGVSEKDLNKIKEAIRLNIEESKNYNNYWLRNLQEAYTRGIHPKEVLDYETFIRKLTAEDLQEAAREYLIKDYYTQFVLYPEKN